MIKLHITRKGLYQLYVDLAERARTDLDFLLLTIASAVICAFGFKMNSASIIVGAMVVSPLLYPIIGVGAAICRVDGRARARAAGTFAAGFLATVVAAAVVNLFYVTTFKSEILDRLSGAPLDYFFVAFFSGLAGTYAFFSPKMHEAIAGIAISVALVPPVTMLGIGLAERNVDFVLASGLIVLCSVFGIVVGSVAMVACLHWLSRWGEQ